VNNVGTGLLTSDRLILRRFFENDADELFKGYINQEEFLYYAGKEKSNIEDIKKSLIKISDKYSELNYYNWAITLKDTSVIIGSIKLKINDTNDSVEFNYAIDNRYTGNGYMTEALRTVKDFCLEELKVNRFQGGCCVENIASRKVMEKCDMFCEGILKSYIKLKDGYHDMYMYSIINKRKLKYYSDAQVEIISEEVKEYLEKGE